MNDFQIWKFFKKIHENQSNGNFKIVLLIEINKNQENFEWCENILNQMVQFV